MKKLKALCKVFAVYPALLWLVLSACAQGRRNIKNAYAYWQAIYPGTNRVFRPGEPKHSLMDTVLLVYLETATDVTPVWNTALRNGLVYNAEVLPITADSVIAGIVMATREPVIIRAAKGNRLWQVVLARQPGQIFSFGDQFTKSPVVLIDTLQHPRKTLSTDTAIEIMPQRRP